VTSQGAVVGGVVLMNGGVFRRTSKILFGNMVCLSFRWLLLVNSAYIRNLSIVLGCAPLLWCFNTCILLCMVPKEWLCSMRLWENFEE
jgi:hypothetical protein